MNREKRMECCATAQKGQRSKSWQRVTGGERGFAIILATIKDGLGCLSVVCTLCVQQIETGISDLLGARLFHAPHGNESLCTQIKARLPHRLQ